MPLVTDDLALHANLPTLALKTTDNFKFSQLVETVKDVFIRELRVFFAMPTTAAARFAEVLTIDKFGISAVGTNPFENLVTLIREYPDIEQQLPLISVTKAGGSKRPIGIGGAFVDHVQYPPRVRGSAAGPYDLSAIINDMNPPRLVFKTRPDGVNDVTSTMVLVSKFFANTSAVTVRELVAAINFQALYAAAREVIVGASVYLELMAGGRLRMTSPLAQPAATNPRAYPVSNPETPNRIEIIAGGTAALLTALGFTVGQSDSSDNPDRRPANRYSLAANFTVGLDIGAKSDNTRTELTDLLIYFLSMYMNDRDYTFYGQHVFEEPAAATESERYFQVIMGDWSMAGEADIPRADGEKEDKVYANRFTVPVVIFDYVDRMVPSNLIPPTVEIDETLPQGS